ncbi:hypothetical protein KKF03_05770 [Patescibacteria group bacterium]|nr:hypothetical protein [Patescibacteria group bacterium]
MLEASEESVRITEPKDGDSVPVGPFVKGIVSDPQVKKVWVIVHPMEVADCWVQQSANVKEDRTWKVKVAIGRPGRKDVGKQFEIMAVVNPESKLRVGDILPGWPEAQWTSQVIEVTRK